MKSFQNDSLLWAACLLPASLCLLVNPVYSQHQHAHASVKFSVRSVKSGAWSDQEIWQPAQVPQQGDRVLISSGTHVQYDVKEPKVIRLVQVVGTLQFASDRDTELNVGLMTIQHVEECSEQGFVCEFEGAANGPKTPLDRWPSLIVGTVETPIPAKHTAKIRLQYLPGMDPNDAPAIACCSGRLDLHGSPLSRTWIKLAADAPVGTTKITLAEPMQDWRVGDEVLITATDRSEGSGTFRKGAKRAREPQAEERRITAIAGATLTIDRPLQYAHLGSGEFRGEIANLSRNVIIESADPQGVRGHTVYHRFSKGSISYAKFAHLGKEGVLGRYPIHYHLVGDTMRGSIVKGVSIVDSHNRWVTIHGAQYLVVQDCVGYQSVGHGFFLEDGTEIFNLLDRNLAVQAYFGKRLPKQVLPFDPNDGAGFWLANGMNTITHNVTSENDEYGYRFDMQKRSNFNPMLAIRQPDGSEKEVDVRTLPLWRFENNEAHTEGFYGMVVAANGNDQPDSPINDERMLQEIKKIDWTGPDTKHPHMIRNLSIWGAHYAFRPHSPAMSMENLRIHDAVYGIYRPAFENHVYRNVSISNIDSEPFNRGMDDASAQVGSITVDGLTFRTGRGDRTTPLIQISDVNLSGTAATHLRNLTVHRAEQAKDRWPLFNRGVGTRVAPLTIGVPVFVHDYFGPGRHAKVISTAAQDLMTDGNSYREEPMLTSDESRVAEVRDIPWPELLHPVDDVPPVTIITSVRRVAGKLEVNGISHDNGEIVSVQVNGAAANIDNRSAGSVYWQAKIDLPVQRELSALAVDDAGNQEKTPHQVAIENLTNRLTTAKSMPRSHDIQ